MTKIVNIFLDCEGKFAEDIRDRVKQTGDDHFRLVKSRKLTHLVIVDSYAKIKVNEKDKWYGFFDLSLETDDKTVFPKNVRRLERFCETYSEIELMALAVRSGQLEKENKRRFRDPI